METSSAFGLSTPVQESVAASESFTDSMLRSRPTSTPFSWIVCSRTPLEEAQFDCFVLEADVV